MEIVFYKSIAALLVATSFSVVAVAQPITESDATSILDNYGSSFNALAINTCLDRNQQALTGSALKEAFTVKQNEIVGMLNRGDKSLAAGKATSLLGAFGHCYSVSTNTVDRSTYAKFMGGLIATEALPYRDNDKMQKAITLLDYSKSHLSENTQFMKLVEPFRKSENVDVTPSGDTSEVNFYELGELYKSNQLRLRKKYDGKIVIGEAKVHRVGEHRDGRIFINLDGPKVVDTASGELSSSWMLVCNIEQGSTSEDKAIDLDKSDTFRIKGTMEVFKKTYFSPAVQQCEILD